MDDLRFDDLVRALAEGKSRRAILKGMLGLGGAVAIGSAAMEREADAARRPNPTPTPATCPGKQIRSGSACVCPAAAPNKCGPDCCTGKPGDLPIAGHSECCDNACCFGTCYGEELCCPTNPVGAGAPLAEYCANTHECCLSPSVCCGAGGCCDTVCLSAGGGPEFCCPDAGYCPGATRDDDLCCFDGETCCNGGTANRRCVDLANDECCTTADCTAGGTLCRNCSENYVCSTTVCSEGSVCCPTVDGPNICVAGACCSDAACDGPCQQCSTSDGTAGTCISACDGPCCGSGAGAYCALGACCPDGNGCGSDAPVCCGEGSNAHCATRIECYGCDACADRAAECCDVNGVFDHCYYPEQGECCADEDCAAYTNPSICGVGRCVDSICTTRSVCDAGEYCCSETCSITACDGPPRECSRCEEIGQLCCYLGLEFGACCTGGEHCCGGSCVPLDTPCVD